MGEEIYRIAAFVVAVTVSLVILGAPLFSKNEWQSDLVRNHPVTLFLGPIAGCSSFIVIAFFGAVAGPIKISLWGIQIEGTSGAVLLWILCLLAFALGARLTWELKP